MSRARADRLSLLAKRSGRTFEDVTEMWNERAAIREYDGGMSRRDAEQIAEGDVANEVMR